MVLESIPPIAYDSVESYWKRIYMKENNLGRNHSARPADDNRNETNESARQIDPNQNGMRLLLYER